MSEFNPEAFLNMELDQDFATVPVPVAEGQWNDPVIVDVKARKVDRKDGSGSFISLDMRVEIHDPELRDEMGFAEDRKPSCRYSMILDTDDNGALKGSDEGDANWRLGALFQACGMTKPYLLANLKGAGAGSCIVKQELNPKTQTMVANIVSMSADRRE